MKFKGDKTYYDIVKTVHLSNPTTFIFSLLSIPYKYIAYKNTYAFIMYFGGLLLLLLIQYKSI